MIELNIDGLVGPTHYFGGLSYGNVPSMAHKGRVSSPKKAALEGLEKMKLVADLGVKQAVFPPHPRPLNGIWSASSMWMANAAHISPSPDCNDGKVHITPANMSATPHRSIEAPYTEELLKKFFADPRYFVHHPPAAAKDEGAANTIRFSSGLHLFVYGKDGKRFPARQSREALEEIARTHQLKNVLFAQQNPKAIDAGVFHNDVISFGGGGFFVYHEDAFVDDPPIPGIKITREQMSLDEAVKTYFFNSQLLPSLPALICPETCKGHPVLDLMPFPIYFVSLKQSLDNGGGPACLRLRVVLTQQEFESIPTSFLFSESLYQELKEWIGKHYRDTLSEIDFSDPMFAAECRLVLDGLKMDV